jgi:hypothetical protein
MNNFPTWEDIEKDVTPNLINHYYVPSIRDIAFTFRQSSENTSSVFDSYRSYTHTSQSNEYERFNDVINEFIKQPNIDKATEHLISYIHVDTNKWCHANAVKLRMLNSYSFAYKAYTHKDYKIQHFRVKHTQYTQIPNSHSHCLRNWQANGGYNAYYTTPTYLNPFGSFFYLISCVDVGLINKRSHSARHASSVKAIGGECLIAFRRYYADNFKEVIQNNEIPGVKYKSDLRANHVDFNFRTFDLRSACNNKSMYEVDVEGAIANTYSRRAASFLIYTRNSKPL